MNQVQVKSVEIGGVEGTIAYSDMFPMKFADIKSANTMLKQSCIYNGDEHGFKHRVTITWEDNETYVADLYVKGLEDTDIKSHIEEYLNASLGRVTKYKGILAVSEEDAAEIREFMKFYSLV